MGAHVGLLGAFAVAGYADDTPGIAYLESPDAGEVSKHPGTVAKLAYSGGNGGGCVETGVVDAGRVLVRDTTNLDGAVLSIPAEAWQAFTDRLK